MKSLHAFSPLPIGSMTLPARVFKTATSETCATEDGEVSDLLLDFYDPIAQAGTPLIITGAIYVSADGKAANYQLGADNDVRKQGLNRLTDRVHVYGGRIIAQLNHAGRQMIPSALGLGAAVSSSAVYEWSLGTRPRQLDEPEIRRISAAFADAARRCQEAGFDGIQLQAAHGYLISQFLTPHTNRRRDDYRVTPQGQSKFLIEVYETVRKAVGKDFPVLLKINGDDALILGRGLGTDALVETAHTMQERGVAAIEVSVGHYVSLFPGFRGRFTEYLRDFLDVGVGAQLPPLQKHGMKIGRPLLGALLNLWRPARQGFNLQYAKRFKARLSIPVICVGGFHELDEINRAIGAGECDAVSIGRAMIADPSFYRNLRVGTSGPKCDYCNRCLAVAGTRRIDCYNDAVRRRPLQSSELRRRAP